MKLSFISLVLSVGLAISQVTASPLHVVVVGGSEVTSPSRVRLGHSVAAAKDMQHIPVFNSLAAATAEMNKEPKRKGCLGNKAMQATNWLRISFGLPPLDHNNIDPTLPSVRTAVIRPHSDLVETMAKHGHHHNAGKFHVKHHSQAFVDRLTRALMMLGPWEGRAVAFVLGCGLGALLRMFWVLVIITARAMRGRSQQEDEIVDVVIFEEQEHLLPPPQYELTSEAPGDVKEKAEN